MGVWTLRRFHGSVALDPTLPGRDASRIADEAISHLTGLVGTQVRVTLEIEAEVLGAAPELVARIVAESGRALKSGNLGLEAE